MSNPLKAIQPVTLHQALQDATNHFEDIKPLVHPDLANSKNSLGESPLKLACGNHGPDVIECIVDIGANINERIGIYKYTALHVAAGAGYLALCQRLIRDNGHINAQASDGRTPLYEAIKNHQTDTAQALIEAGAHLHLYDNNRWTHLHVAVAEDQVELVKVLLRSLKVEQLNAKTQSGYTPLYLACEKGNLKTIQLLLHKTADINIANGPNGETALHLATKKNKLDVLALVLEKKPKVDLKDQSGFTPLFLAYLHGHIAAASKLIAAGANVNNVCGRDAETPLYPAIRSERLGLVSELLVHQVQVNIKNTHKATPLETACQSDNFDAAEALIGAKAEVRIQALQAAVKHARHHLLRFLLSHFPHLNRDSSSLLYFAILRGDPEILEILLDAGLNVNTKCGLNGEMQPPIHWAAIKGNVALIEVLLQRQAKFDTKINGKTPLDLAQENGHTEAARILYPR